MLPKLALKVKHQFSVNLLSIYMICINKILQGKLGSRVIGNLIVDLRIIRPVIEQFKSDFSGGQFEKHDQLSIYRLEDFGISTYYKEQTSWDMIRQLSENYLTHSGWLESAHTKIPISLGKPVPWITYPALAYLEKNYSRYSRVTEFGSGFSTLYFLNKNYFVTSYESDDNWVAWILAMTNHLSYIQNKKLKVIPIRKSISDFGDISETHKTFHEYKEVFQREIASSDLIYIDGDFRNELLVLCAESNKTTLTVILDNSDREEYSAGVEAMKKANFKQIDFYGLGPVNPYSWCTTFFERC